MPVNLSACYLCQPQSWEVCIKIFEGFIRETEKSLGTKLSISTSLYRGYPLIRRCTESGDLQIFINLHDTRKQACLDAKFSSMALSFSIYITLCIHVLSTLLRKSEKHRLRYANDKYIKSIPPSGYIISQVFVSFSFCRITLLSVR